MDSSSSSGPGRAWIAQRQLPGAARHADRRQPAGQLEMVQQMPGTTYAMPTRPSDGSYPVNGERLIHEFTHAWQIQHNSFVPGFVSSGIVNQGASIMGDDVYEHGLPGAPWASFNLKQQAQMVNQWYGGDNRQQHWGPMIQIILTTST
jgi:hypothetical protein